VIQSGKVLCHGTPDEVLANPEAQKVYFGDKQDRFRTSTPPQHGEAHTPHSHGHRKHSPHVPHRRVDPDWEIPKEIIEKEPVHEPINDKARPFHLQFHPPTHLASAPEVLTVASQPAEKPSSERQSRRLRPISSSITPDIPPDTDAPPQDDPGMSSIIRNLGQLIWKNK
jgi:hypothetical protein